MIDYSGRLNEHEDYLKMLKNLEEKTDYIGLVPIEDDRFQNNILEKFAGDILEKKKVSEWWGTRVSGSFNYLYKIKASKQLFTYLAQFETFCKFRTCNGTAADNFRIGDVVDWTDFGLHDIAFFEKDGNCLLSTTTHEGYIDVDPKISL